ncbi:MULTISPECIES: hypothetical protein [Bacillati]|uniref:Helix-turn-helix domain containing protein n=1 Tax=Streptomyces virens TaxID=285572 RepID=A0ABN3V2R2_9ACTN
MAYQAGEGRPVGKNKDFFKPRNNVYLACDEMDFTWGTEDVFQFEEMWKKGEDIHSIAKELKRDPDELAILAIDRARLGRIKRRPGGLLGIVGV